MVHYNTNSWKLWGTLQRRYKDTSSTRVQFYMYDEERGVGILTIFETAEGKGQWEWASLLTSSR